MDEIEITNKNGTFIEELFIASTAIPEIIEEESKITTVVIFVISAIFAITLLFIIAVFIDFRQEKLQKLQAKPKRKFVRLRLPVPKVLKVAAMDDRSTIVENMEDNEGAAGPSRTDPSLNV